MHRNSNFYVGVGFLVVLLCPMLVATSAHSQTESPTINSAIVNPNPVTVDDKMATVVANITSKLPLVRVWLYYAVSNSSYLNQHFNYTKTFMFPENTVGQNQYFGIQVPVPSYPCLVVYYINATDANGSRAFYPSPSLSPPDAFLVIEPPSDYLYTPSFTLNNFTLGLQYSYAGLNMTLAGTFPRINGYPIPISVSSLPDGYGVIYPGSMDEQPSYRFSYSVNGSFTTELSGKTSNYPYDTYLFGVNMSIGYPNLNVSNYGVTLYPSNQIANTIQDSWKISTAYETVSHHGNDTVIMVEFELTRSNQPTSLPVIAFGTVILLASALFFEPKDINKRLTVFLTAILLALSVLISSSLNPFGFGNTIYEEYFSYLMLTTAILTAVSVVSWRVEGHPGVSSFIEISVAFVLAVVTELLFLPTPMPVEVSLAPLSIFCVTALAYFVRKRFRNGLWNRWP